MERVYRGEDAYKRLIRYEAVVPAMQEVYSKVDGQKKGSAKKKI